MIIKFLLSALLIPVMYAQTITYEKSESSKAYISYNPKNIISDSPIMIRLDNRFKANSTIYGRYYRRAGSVNCNLAQDIYKIVDDCKAGSLYFKKSNQYSINEFNTETHMIECTYSQKHGLMHDCNVKLKSIEN